MLKPCVVKRHVEQDGLAKLPEVLQNKQHAQKLGTTTRFKQNPEFFRSCKREALLDDCCKELKDVVLEVLPIQLGHN
jgi:hypothetical protein